MYVLLLFNIPISYFKKRIFLMFPFLLNFQNTVDDIKLTCEVTCNSEGLDQIPTRLPIKTKSRSVTPNKGNSNDICK